jgi:hypothetical protein
MDKIFPVTVQPSATMPLPAGTGVRALREQITEACRAWLAKSPSRDTRSNYERDLQQFLAFAGVSADQPEDLTGIRPQHVAAWRDQLQEMGHANASIRRKMTVLRSLFGYLQTYGYTGTNPAHSDFVDAPAVPREGKTVALSPEDCRRLLDAPVAAVVEEGPDGTKNEVLVPAGVRDRALLAILAYAERDYFEQFDCDYAVRFGRCRCHHRRPAARLCSWRGDRDFRKRTRRLGCA